MTHIIPTSTTTLQDIGIVSSDAFSAILPFIYLIAGVVLAFYIVESIIFWTSDYPQRYTDLEKKGKTRQ